MFTAGIKDPALQCVLLEELVFLAFSTSVLCRSEFLHGWGLKHFHLEDYDKLLSWDCLSKLSLHSSKNSFKKFNQIIFFCIILHFLLELCCDICCLWRPLSDNTVMKSSFRFCFGVSWTVSFPGKRWQVRVCSSFGLGKKGRFSRTRSLHELVGVHKGQSCSAWLWGKRTTRKHRNSKTLNS